MSFGDYPASGYFLVLDDSAQSELGSYTLSGDGELQYIQVTLIIHGTRAGSEQLRLNVYNAADYAGPIATSSWSNVADISTLAEYWYGFLRFSFNREHLDSSNTFYLGLETNNYTKSSANYIGAKLDWPDDVNTATDSTSRGVQARWFLYREL